MRGFITALACIGLLALVGCGEDPVSTTSGCTVNDNGDGTKTISCEDGTEVTLSDGKDGLPGDNGEPGAKGEPGSSCSVQDNRDGTKTIYCEDGTEVTVNNGENGEPGDDGKQGEKGEPGEDGKQGESGEPGDDGKQGENGEKGEKGEKGDSCTVKDNGDGTKTISCEDGTEVTVSNGENGEPGEKGETGEKGDSCTVIDNGDGTKTITCEDGTEVTINSSCNSNDECGTNVCIAGECVQSVETITGTFTIYNDLDVANLQPYEVIDGSVTIFGPPTVALPNLKTITGNLRVRQHSETNIMVTDLNCPALESVGDEFSIDDSNIVTLSVPVLKTVGNKFELVSNKHIESLKLPSLDSNTWVQIGSNLELVECDLSSLTDANSVIITSNSNLKTINLPKLSVLTEKPGGGDFHVSHCAALETLNVQNLIDVHTLYVSDNSALTTWDFSLLSNVDSQLYVTNNPLLPSCLVDAIQTQTAFSGPSLKTTGNNTSCTCAEVNGVMEATCP